MTQAPQAPQPGFPRPPQAQAHAKDGRPRPAAPARPKSLYIAGWVALGLGALGYLGVTMLGAGGPAMKADRLDATSPDATVMQQTLARIAQDVHQIQGRLTVAEDQSQVTLGRLASLEEKTAVLAMHGQQAAGPAGAGSAAGRNDITTGAILQKSATPLAPPTSLTPPAVMAAQAKAEKAAAKAESGAAVAAAKASGPSTGNAVVLASADTLDALRLNWTLLSERHRDLLGSMQTRYRQASGKPNAPYQLLAGPISTPADANRLCKTLAAQGIACRATTFAGEAL